jgi:hypothetical protein
VGVFVLSRKIGRAAAAGRLGGRGRMRRLRSRASGSRWLRTGASWGGSLRASGRGHGCLDSGGRSGSARLRSRRGSRGALLHCGTCWSDRNDRTVDSGRTGTGAGTSVGAVVGMQLNVLAASHIIAIGRCVDVQSSILTSLTGDKVCLSVVGEQALGVDGEASGGLGSSITLELGGGSYRCLLRRCQFVRTESRYSRVKMQPRP